MVHSKPNLRGHGRGRHAVLAGARLGDHALLAHALHEQALPHHVVRLVRAGVVQILALDVDARAAEVRRQVLGVGDRRGPAGVAGHQRFVLVPERGIGLGRAKGLLELVEGGDENLGDEGAAESSVVAAFMHRRSLA